MTRYQMWDRSSLERLAEDLTDRVIELNELRGLAELLVAYKRESRFIPQSLYQKIDVALDFNGEGQKKLEEAGFIRGEYGDFEDCGSGKTFQFMGDALQYLKESGRG